MSQIAVTGATGVVGKALLRHVQAAGMRGVALSRQATPHASANLTRQVDLHRPQRLGQALAGCNIVVHLAGAIEGSAAELYRANVLATKNLVEAARAEQVECFVHVSSAGVYGERAGDLPFTESSTPNPQTDYERSKLDGEHAVIDTLAQTRTRFVLLRPTGVFADERAASIRFLREILERKWWLHAPPRLLVHPLPVDDLCRAIRLAIARPLPSGTLLNIAGERAIFLDEWIDLLARSAGSGLRQLRLGGRAVRITAQGITTLADRLHVPVPARLRRATQASMSRAVSIERARDLLGYDPQPLAAAAEAIVARILARPSA
ncbi:MAG: NAD(P)-dependent oxidoreductase [Steroidobacteraceae bacterium]